jgi:hypothetical protein
MSSWWKTAKDILKGKAKGSKLIILGVFMVSIGAALVIVYPTSGWTAGIWFFILGQFAFMRGVWLYEEEARAELRKKKEKEDAKQNQEE